MQLDNLPKGKYTILVDNHWNANDVRDYTVRIYAKSQINITPVSFQKAPVIHQSTQRPKIEDKFKEAYQMKNSFQPMLDDGFNMRQGMVGSNFYYAGAEGVAKGRNAEFTYYLASKNDMNS